MAVVQNQRDHVVPLTIGLLGPREARNVDTGLPLEASLIADGTLAVVDNAQAPQYPTPLGTFRGTVVDTGSLPGAANKLGDVFLVLTDEEVSGALLRYWDGSAWQPLAGGSGGIGPVADFIDIPGALTGIGTGQTIAWDGSEFDPAGVA